MTEVVITFRSERRTPPSVDKLTEMEVYYDFFLGDIALLIGSVRFPYETETLPLVGFTYSLRSTISELRVQSSVVLEFPDDGLEWIFHGARGADVVVSTNYETQCARTTLSELETATQLAMCEALRGAEAILPGFQRGDFANRMDREFGWREWNAPQR